MAGLIIMLAISGAFAAMALVEYMAYRLGLVRDELPGRRSS